METVVVLGIVIFVLLDIILLIVIKEWDHQRRKILKKSKEKTDKISIKHRTYSYGSIFDSFRHKNKK